MAVAYEPRVNYMLQCMGCHTPDGSGESGRVPSIKATLARFSMSAEGRRFLVQVPGASQSTLSDAELAELLNWMIQNLSTTKPPRLTAFTEAEVASYRRTPLVEVQITRERLLRSPPVSSSPTP
jgi:mono/diheme cytochrome c family protein